MRSKDEWRLVSFKARIIGTPGQTVDEETVYQLSGLSLDTK